MTFLLFTLWPLPQYYGLVVLATGCPDHHCGCLLASRRMIRKRKGNGLSYTAALFVLCLQQMVKAQIELAPANLGLKLTPPDAHVKAVPGRNPNLPPWFEDLGVDSFGEILGHTDMADLKSNSPAQSPLDNMGLALGDEEPQSQHSVISTRVGTDGLVSVGEAQSVVKADGDDSSSSDSSSSSGIHISVNGTDSWESIDLKNSTEVSKNMSAIAVTPVRLAGIPYPKEEPIDIHDLPRTSRNTLQSEVVLGVAEKSLLPPAEALEVDQYRPKAKSIPLWKPKAKAAEPPNLFILPQDNPKRIISTNIDMMRPIIATSTFTTKISGSILTSTTVSTIDQKALKFKSCIYGCPAMTSTDSLVGTTTIITVLPYQIPCSLVSCPPCPACFQSTVSVSVCPVIDTVTAKARTSFVNGPTITVIRSTVTRTQCTATRTISAKPAPPETTTETVTVTVSENSRSSRQSSSSTRSEEGKAIGSGESERTPFVDRSLVLGGSDQEQQQSQASKEPLSLASTITETILSTVYATPIKHLPSLTITKTVVSERIVITVTSTALAVTPVEASTAGICSTFVICNPTQFTCPAQVTNLPQIKAVVEAIMDGQEKYGRGGAGTRRLTPNGAFIDDMGPVGLFGDGSELAGGLNPVNRFGFGPGGMFEKVLGPDLIPPMETGTEALLPPGASTTTTSSTETVASQAKMTVSELPMSTTRIVEAIAEPTGALRRNKIKRGRKQACSGSASSRRPAQLMTLLLASFFLLFI